jgi:Fe-S-cluster-containing dehydrogenase component/CRP-like cAMP-binding protein
VVVEVPAGLFRRGAGRSEDNQPRARETRALVRAATADLLRATAATRDLPQLEFDMALDAVTLRRFDRGEAIYRVGEPASAVYFVVDGLVQLQVEDEESIRIQAYLTRGDAFGHDDLGTVRGLQAASVGPTRCLQVPARVFRTIMDRTPGLAERLGRVKAERRQQQHAVVAAAAERSTQHVFHDLYRMQMARSMLVIDPESCVRCGHCAWSCAASHDDGVARLVRRGDKVVTSLAVAGQIQKSLLIPNSCQHCKNPACMVDCPTGAIGRDVRGDVFIREELCTGCGHCAKACPWENISMAPRRAASHRVSDPMAQVATALRGTSAEVAVKCDLCRGFDGPACVQACPTDAITRLDPGRDVAEVAAVLGPEAEGPSSPVRAWLSGGVPLTAWACAALVGIGITGFRLQAEGVWSPGLGPGATAGWTALVLAGLSAAYAIPKRVVRLWHHRARKVSSTRARVAGEPEPAPRSRLRPLMSLHIVLGVAMAAAVAAHAGPRWPGGVASLLSVVFWTAIVTGSLGALAYRWLPRRLSRIEREAALPEDYSGRKAELIDRLYRETTGRSDVVKALVAGVLRPYARSSMATLGLLVSGRTLRQEQDRLRARVDRVRQGRGEDRLDGVDALIRTVVQLRALPLLRWGHRILRGWLPAHIVGGAVLLVAVVAHVLVVTGAP